jgi:uncharacterized protein (DUF302 family)
VSTSTALFAADNDLGCSRRWSVPVVRSAVAFVAQLDLFIVKDHPGARTRIGLRPSTIMEPNMKQKLQVNHIAHSTTRSFDQVVKAFETVVGTLEDIGWASIPRAAKDAADFEARVNAKIGPSGFTRFLTVDHGGWLSFFGKPGKARQYVIGNPLIAITMLRHDVGAGLNVPVRVYIYRDEANGTTRFEYDQPSTLMSGLANKDATAAAEKLDGKLAALAEQVTGSKA